MKGGARPGAGRPKGTTKDPTVVYYRRVKPEWVAVLDRKIEKLKGFKMKKYTENEICGLLIDYTSNAVNVDFEQFGEFEELVREEFGEFDRKWNKLECDDEGFNPEQAAEADALEEKYTQNILKIIGQ